MVGSSPTLLVSAFFGALDLDKAAILCFPQGLPGFENERRFAAIQIPEQKPLVYLQSATTPGLCLLALPVTSIQPGFVLNLRPEDRDVIDSDRTSLSKPITLAIVASEADGTVTANLAAPIVINPQNGFAVQAIQTNPDLSYRHPLPC